MPETTVAILFSIELYSVSITTLGEIFKSNVTNIGLIAALFMLLRPMNQLEKKIIQTLYPISIYSITLRNLLLFEIELEDKDDIQLMTSKHTKT